MPLARIGLGSNLGDALTNVRMAIGALEKVGRVQAVSHLYSSAAWGVTDQPDFCNAAVLLETELSPHGLLARLKVMESALGRVPSYRWGPRSIDLDILAYDDIVLDDPELTLPHPRLFERAFALGPLSEIDPTFVPAYERLAQEEKATIRRV